MIDVRRVGAMVMSSDSVVEADFKRYLPPSVTFHTARLLHRDQTPRGAPTLDEVCEGIEVAADSLLQINPEVIVFGCTSASFYKGAGWDDQLRERITKRTGIPAIVTSTAVKHAFKVLNIHKAFMITPYPEDINSREIKFFADAGIDISQFSYFQLKLSKDICFVEPTAIFDRAISESERIKRCGALFISCTGLRAMEICESLEERLGVPVLTSNASIIFSILEHLGSIGSVELKTSLFKKLAT
jgi:maleate isomerase